MFMTSSFYPSLSIPKNFIWFISKLTGYHHWIIFSRNTHECKFSEFLHMSKCCSAAFILELVVTLTLEILDGASLYSEYWILIISVKSPPNWLFLLRQCAKRHFFFKSQKFSKLKRVCLSVDHSVSVFKHLGVFFRSADLLHLSEQFSCFISLHIQSVLCVGSLL